MLDDPNIESGASTHRQTDVPGSFSPPSPIHEESRPTFLRPLPTPVERRVLELIKSGRIESSEPNAGREIPELSNPALYGNSVVERAQVLGSLAHDAPEVIFSDELRQEMFELERAKIALRSMEHAQPGRAFNDFRAQLGIILPSCLSLLSFELPPRTRAVLQLTTSFSLLLFDAFHDSIERPYIFLPGENEDEPHDFMSGVRKMEKILPMVMILEDSLRSLVAVSADGITDLDRNDSRRLIALLWKSLASLDREWDLSATVPKKFDLEMFMGSFCDGARQAAASIRGADLEIDEKSHMLKMLSLGCDQLEQISRKRADRTMDSEENAKMNRVAEGFRTALLDISDSIEPPEKYEDAKYLADLLEEPLRKAELAREIALDRIQFAKGQIELETINISEIIRRLPEQVLPSPPHETLILHLPEDIEITAIGNKRRIQGALSNIVSNAFHYGNVLEVTLSYDDRTNEAVISLRDDGKGVLPELLEEGSIPGRERIFDLGVTRRQHDSKNQKKGTGVGTTESLYVFQMHDGGLSVSSIREPDPMHGTTFIARFPADRVVEDRLGLSRDKFEHEIRERFGERGLLLFQAAFEESPSEIRLRAEPLTYRLISDSGDPIGALMKRFATGTLNSAVRVDIGETIFSLDDTERAKILLRDIILPIEVEQTISDLHSSELLVQQGTLLSRTMKRYDLLHEERQIALREALTHASCASDDSRALALSLEDSKGESLPHRSLEALRLASSSQLRPISLRDFHSLAHEIQVRSFSVDTCTVAEGLSGEMREELSRKLEEIMSVFEISEQSTFARLLKRSVIEETEIPLRAVSVRYPSDAEGLLLYLVEHGLLASVLRRMSDSEIREWKSLSQDVLPRAAHAVENGFYEELLDRSKKSGRARHQAETLAQLPFLGLDAYREMDRVLKSSGIEPIGQAARIRAEEAALADWRPLIDTCSRLVLETGVDEILYQRMTEPGGGWASDSIAVIVQALYVRSPLEARELLNVVADVFSRLSLQDADIGNIFSPVVAGALIDKLKELEELIFSMKQDGNRAVSDPAAALSLQHILESTKLFQ